jgi:transcription antitermination factor NusG
MYGCNLDSVPSSQPEQGEQPVPGDWYAAYTKHQHEKKVADYLANVGFEVFSPVYVAAHRWKDRTQMVTLPLFPCYVFLRADLARKLEILRAPGVFGLVGNGGRASSIPDGDLDMVRRVTADRTRVAPHPYLKCGDRVRVCVGPLVGAEGILIKVKNRYRVVVSVELLQKAVAVEVDLSVLERLGFSTGSMTSSGVSQRIA